MSYDTTEEKTTAQASFFYIYIRLYTTRFYHYPRLDRFTERNVSELPGFKGRFESLFESETFPDGVYREGRT